MEIRVATDTDVPAIVSLLKRSLGENLMPKSAGYWRWKHIENPFGRSPVLCCLEGTELVGVRAFMRWEWTFDGRIYKALRAVDTATHPDYMGKGIFKKLTLSLADQCTAEGDQFVFNTPNNQSKPGYLKMGWTEAGKLPILFSPDRPFAILKNLLRGRAPAAGPMPTCDINYYLRHKGLESLLKDHFSRSASMVSNISIPYLQWRYANVPVAKYIVVAEENGDTLDGLIIARIKDTSRGRELRITECLLKTTNNGRNLARQLDEKKKEWQIDVTTMSATGYHPATKVFSGLKIKAAFGPMVTVRSLKLADLNMLHHFTQWSPSLGDLELF